MLQHASLLLLIFHPRQAAGGDEDDDGKGTGAEQEKESSGCAYFSGWPFQDGEEYETSDSDDFDDDDSEEDGEDGAAAAVAAAEAAGGLEQLAERRRAMPPLDYVAKEPGGDDGKCNVVLCPCIEERCRVRKLLCLLHTIAGDDSACMLANACWDTTRPEAVPAVQAKAADSSIVDDAVAVQLPVTCVHALLMHGVSPDHCGREGQTALDAAIQCKNVAAAAALCTHGADVSAYASQHMLDALALAADPKDKRIAKLQELLKQHSATGRGSACEAAQMKCRSAWLRAAARICCMHNAQTPHIQRNRDASQAPDAALALPIVQSVQALAPKLAADYTKVRAPFCR